MTISRSGGAALEGVARRRARLADLYDSVEAKRRRVETPTRFGEIEHTARASAIDRGHAIMHAMRQKLAELDTETFFRSKDQRLIQHRIMAALARFVYGPQLRSHELEVRRYNNFKELNQHILLTAPRRGGKSQAIAMMCAVMMLCVPAISIVVFAPNARSAGGESGLMGHVRKILETKFHVRSFKKTSQETLVYQASEGDDRVFHSYPGSATHKYVYFVFSLFFAYTFSRSLVLLFSSMRARLYTKIGTFYD